MLFDLSSERVLLRLKGNIWQFMNAICTKDMIKFQQDQPAQMSAAFVLNSSGRVVADLLISKMNENEINLEIHESLLDTFQSLIEQLNFRNSVQVSTQSDLEVFGMLGDRLATDKNCYQIKTKNSQLLFEHPNGLGWRLYLRDLDLKKEKFSSIEEWNQLRVLKYGIPESPYDILSGKAFPFESNGDLLGMVDLEKGCYMGQELIARTMLAQVIRKRLIPYSSKEEVNPTAPIFCESGEQIGKVISVYHYESNYFGFALLKQSPNSFDQNKLSVENVEITLHRPSYFSQNYF